MQRSSTATHSGAFGCGWSVERIVTIKARNTRRQSTPGKTSECSIAFSLHPYPVASTPQASKPARIASIFAGIDGSGANGQP